VTNGPTIETLMSEFIPELVSAERFARVEDLVRVATATCKPETPSRARDLLRYATYLAAWCDSEYLPLRIDAVFHPKTIEAFVATLDTVVPARSAATVAATLRSMARVVGPGGKAERRQHPAREPKAPYGPDDVATLFDLAERSRFMKRRHDLAALLVLGLGAGASGQEAAQTRPADVSNEDGQVTVVLRRLQVDGLWRKRSVDVLPRYGSRLVSLAETADTYLLGGGQSRHSRVYDLCDHSRAGAWPVPLDAARLRATYLFTIASEPNTALGLLQRAGVASFEVFGDLLPYLRAGAKLPA
jgi:hypothetical protein